MTSDKELDDEFDAWLADAERLIGLVEQAVKVYQVNLPESLVWRPEMERLLATYRKMGEALNAFGMAHVAAADTDRERTGRLATLLRDRLPPGRA